jgi:WD40 repeat protein
MKPRTVLVLAVIALGGFGTLATVALSGDPEAPPVVIERANDKAVEVALSPDESLVATASDDNTVRIFGMKDGALVATIAPSPDSQGWPKLAWSPRSDRIAIGGTVVRIVAVASKSVVATIPAPAKEPPARVQQRLAWSPDGRLVAESTVTPKLRLCSAEDGKVLTELDMSHTELRNDYVAALDFSPSGDRIAAAGGDNTLFLFSIDGKLLWKGKVATNHYTWALRFASDGQTIVLPGYARLTVYSAADGHPLNTVSSGKDTGILELGPVEGDLVLARAYPGRLERWSLAKGERVAKADLPPAVDWRFSRSGRRVALVERSGTVRVLAVGTILR